MSLAALLSFFVFSLLSSEALAKGDCAADPAPVLDGRGIRIEFDSAERGYDCLAIKNKLGGEAVPFSDGASDAKRLFDELGVDGVYLDQVSCSLPQPCHDASHGHSLGGGDFWTQGYRELMKPIREEAVKHGAALTSECAAEPYMDSFDAFLTWFGNSPNDVPLLPAVYSGHALYFGCSQSKGDSLDSYCALNARMFLWGVQLGWTSILFEKGREKEVEFTRKICRARLESLDYFLYGELIGEVIPAGEVQMADVKWDRDKVGEFKVPAVFGTVWRNSGGERRAFIVNITGEERHFAGRLVKNGKQFTVDIPPRSVMIRMNGEWKVL